MKDKMNKKIAGIMVVLVLIFSLSACGKELKNENSPEKGASTSDEINYTDNGKDAPVKDTAVKDETVVVNKELVNQKYIEILEEIYTSQKLPDGKELDFVDGDDISGNKFAIFDIDNDGKDELMIEYITASMAGMVELIYEFDSSDNTVREEFVEFPNLTFYDNGIIIAGWSHNQGYAGDFWPYTLYQYNKETDTYDEIRMVDAWDKSLSETDYEGNSFPEDADVDKDGIVYYIMLDGEYNLDEPVDLEEYNQWYKSYVGDGKEVTISFMNLTEENIQGI